MTSFEFASYMHNYKSIRKYQVRHLGSGVSESSITQQTRSIIGTMLIHMVHNGHQINVNESSQATHRVASIVIPDMQCKL
ncbi:unnamed protein product [Heterobilharzia americana]|nr:unnamed protein product [Heterobilharzia americana]